MFELNSLFQKHSFLQHRNTATPIVLGSCFRRNDEEGNRYDEQEVENHFMLRLSKNTALFWILCGLALLFYAAAYVYMK